MGQGVGEATEQCVTSGLRHTALHIEIQLSLDTAVHQELTIPERRKGDSTVLPDKFGLNSATSKVLD